VDLISTVRCTLKSMGVTSKCVNTNYFTRHLRRDLAGTQDELLEMLKPILDVISELTAQIQTLDREIQQMANESYPETTRLSQITGVGALTALTFVLVVGDPQRFLKPRDVGAYLGMVPKRDQSGDLDKEMRISKAGNKYLRQLLVGSAQYILGSFGPDCDLRTQGLKLVARGGKRAKKKAVVATARKLSVVMLTLLRDNSNYDACRSQPDKETVRVPA
jgi:transposase